jgi:putative endonuclease
MHYLYIIYSDSLDKYYVGETPDVEIRLAQHNNHYFKTNFTKSANDWKLSTKHEYRNRREALFLEKFMKKMKSRLFIEKIIAKPEILVDLLKKYSP